MDKSNPIISIFIYHLFECKNVSHQEATKLYSQILDEKGAKKIDKMYFTILAHDKLNEYAEFYDSKLLMDGYNVYSKRAIKIIDQYGKDNNFTMARKMLKIFEKYTNIAMRQFFKHGNTDALDYFIKRDDINKQGLLRLACVQDKLDSLKYLVKNLPKDVEIPEDLLDGALDNDWPC